MKKLLLPLFLAIATTAVLVSLSASLTSATSSFQQWDGTPAFLPYIQKPANTPTFTPTPTATATSTATSTPTPSSTPTATPIPTATATSIPLPSGDNQVCNTTGNVQICAWVSNGTPDKFSTVVVYGSLRVSGQPQDGHGMTSTWHYRTTTVTCDSGVTGTNGIASCSRSIGNASSDYQVDVVVKILSYQVTTWFIPN